VSAPEPSALSLLPPLLALAVAVGTRRVVPALALGGLSGTWLMAWRGGAAPLEVLIAGPVDFVRLGVLGQVSQPGNAQVMVLIALIGGFVGLLERSGAARALTAAITHRVRGPRQAGLAAWAGGLALFFSDFGNVLILGPVFRPIFDRLRIPREKLAWIIDSTAAPVCVLVPVIAWGVYAMGLIEDGFRGMDPAAVEASMPGLWDAAAGTVDGWGGFLAALPFQLYPLLCLVAVPALLLAGRDLGPMKRARPTEAPEEEAEEAGAGLTPAAALVPLAVLFAVMAAVASAEAAAAGKLTGASVRLALAAAYLSATLTALGMLWRAGRLPHVAGAVREGMGSSAPLLILLVLAWTLGAVCKDLGTGAYLSAAIGGGLPPALLPLALFLVGAATSFATGTSWGTFAILMPLAIPLAVSMGAPAAVSIGAVLSGGVWGDHCSPISDTTLLASMGAGCEHAEHVATQLPYAALTGACAGAAFAVAGVTAAPWSVAVGAAGLLSAAAWLRIRG